MNRRGFIGRMLAASAALVAATKAAPAALAVAEKPKRLLKAKVSADTTGLTDSLTSARLEIERLLKDCRVRSFSVADSAGELRRVRATYDYAPKSKKTPFDDQVAAVVGGGKGRVVSATVSATCDTLDITHLGEWKIRRENPKYEIDVEWVVV